MTGHPPYTTRITAAGHSVTVTSHLPAVTGWSTRYFGPWWNATAAADGTAREGEPEVSADVAPAELAQLAEVVLDQPHEKISYAGSTLTHRREADGTVTAAQPGQSLAFRYDPAAGQLRVAGADDTPVATAAARLARELLRGKLLADGWQILHASAAVKDGDTVLTLGGKGAGKTTTGLLLARAGWSLLANDRVFIRPDTQDGSLRVLPWPAAAAIGLGLLDALGLYDAVRNRTLAGQRLHPTQHQRVTDALAEGSRTALFSDTGKELKPQFFPDQLDTWLGMSLATGGRAAHVLFPRINPGIAPAAVDDGRELIAADFFTEGTEDRYPDVFGILPVQGDGGRAQRDDLAHRLSQLPRHGVTLGHNSRANADFLAGLVTSSP
ncbi:hypothetical protein ACFVIM_20755 [Streptomyces sp. NPDC057638]|uniref:hypothetical protein n=1 Tax=Streptomyces sp. NPDC057638 TaxID=3346190 RepID=UPI0036A189C1